MQCVKVIATADGGSRFVALEIEQPEGPYVQDVPSLFVSESFPVQGLVFVTVPDDVRDTARHPAPLRQLAVVLSGEFEIETSDGERRRVSPGSSMVFEDTVGRGHVTRVLRGPATFVAVALADSALAV